MKINRNQINTRQNQVLKKQPNTSINIDLSTLNILCKYIISNSSFLRLSNISSLNRMMNNLDKSVYDNPDKLKRIQFIKLGIQARKDYNLTDPSLIKNHILKGLDFDPDFVDFNAPLSIDEINWINKDIIENSAKYGFIYGYADQFIDLCTELKTTDYSHRGEIVKEFENLIDRTKNEFRKCTSDDSLTDITFSLKPGQFENVMTDVYNTVTSPSRRIHTGMQALDEMVGGGFEAGRVYMLLGITGAGKSMTLLDIAYQIKRYNPFYELKDPTKTPCIIYLTMENSIVETVTRLFTIATESQQNMGHYTLQEVIDKLRNEGQLSLNDGSPIDLIIKYKPNRSVDTTYLYSLYDDFHDMGYEPICFIQDHLLRIRSVESSNEPRFELGNIVNEFKSFATEKDIPFLSNFHLNRDAMKEVEEFKSRATNQDVTQKLGKSNISESVQILNNADCAIIINPDYDQQQNKYMAFSLIKMRDYTKMKYFVQPYMFGSTTRLVEDVGGPPMYQTSLHQNNEVKKQENIRTSSANALMDLDQSINEAQNINHTFIDTDKYSMDASIFNNGLDKEIQQEEQEIEEEVPEELNDLPKSIIKKPKKVKDGLIFFDETKNSLNQFDINSLKQDLIS